MEEAETVNSFSEFPGFLDPGELTLLTVQPEHVCFNSLWWLLCDLHRSLEQGDGEVWMWVGGQNESKVRIHIKLI